MLTNEDREWLESHRESLSRSATFYLAQRRGSTSAELAELACQVLIYDNGTFISVKDLAARIVGKVPYSMIYEQWNYWCAEAIYLAAANLPAQDAVALLYASGYAEKSPSELASYCAESVNEARLALYGEPEDW